MANKRKREDKEEERQPKVSSYVLFTQEYYQNKKKKNEPKRPFKEESKSVKEAWNALKDDEKEKYKERAKKLRRGEKGKKYVVPFLTRCAPNQFIEVCKSLKNREERMERLKRIGFDKLVNISCSQIPRDLCGQFMGAFDPPTNNVSIRGRSLHIRSEDVTEFMGLPCVGGDIERNAMNEDKDFQQLKTLYGTVPYKTIGKWLIEREDDADFEFLFIMYALGTLLCPGAGVKVSDRVLKVLVATQPAFGDNDWATFVLSELSNSVGQYKKKVSKGKASGKINVGGCIYFLMVFCLQKFPLGEPQASKNDEAVRYWNDKNVKKRVQIERHSNQGLLHSVGQVVGGPASELHQQNIITHPELKRTYERIMSRVVSIVQEELVSLEARLLGGGEMDAGAEIDEQSSSKNDDEQPSSGSEAEKAAIRKGDDEVWSIHEEDGSEEDNEGEPNRSANEGKDECSEDVLKGEEEVQLRKSTRVKKPALVSPWVTTMTKKRTKDDKHKEALFQLCTTRPNKEDAQELFVEMYDYFVTRGELYCLRERGWINNRFMSMVARTLVGDQLQNSSRVSRHIFSSELMEKMSSDPKKWSWQAHEYEILPEHIRYNIGDCDLIFAPTLRLDHWFCYVLDTKTLRFSVLDSLVDQLTYARLQKREEDGLLEDEKTSKKKRLSQKQQEELRGKERLASQCRDCIISVLRRVKPELFGKGREIPKDINWPKVHVQADIDSCGVHVLSWLFGWDGSAQDKGGYTMPKLSPEQIRQIKVDSLWWLVTHDRNIHAKKVLSIAGDKKQMQGNRDK